MPCLLAAQGFVSSAHFTTVEATGNSSLPFGWATMPFGYQQVHDGVPAQLVQGIGFRHDSTGAVSPAISLTLDVWMSTAATAAAAATVTFDTNHGSDRTHVVSNRVVAVPANDPTMLPGAFLLDIPFDLGVSFPFAGNGASICWEVQITATTNTTNLILFDAVLTQGSTPQSPAFLGTRADTGCLATGRTQPMSITPANSPVDWALGIATQRVNGNQLVAGWVVAWVSGATLRHGTERHCRSCCRPASARPPERARSTPTPC